MLRRTVWYPDTCGCALEYEWDDSVPEASRVHTPTRSLRTCAAHMGSTSPADHHADILDENPRKNRAEARLLAAFPAKLGMSDGQGNTVLRPDAYRYTITGTRGNRVLNLSLPLLTQQERNGVQTWCDNNLGAGRVVVSG